MNKYTHTDKLLIAVDCIIFGFSERKLQLLLVKRDIEPELGQWSLMGGFLFANESLDQGAQRVLHKLTGLENVYLEQLYSFGEVGRDPVDRTISVAYFALINMGDHAPEISGQYHANWFPIDNLPYLIFDHPQMVRKAQDQLRYRATHHPIGFELLPEKFTLPELQSLYEAIFEQHIDRGNFHRRIRSLDVLIKLEEKQRGYSKKGAYYYTFDEKKYRERMQSGANFLIKP